MKTWTVAAGAFAAVAVFSGCAGGSVANSTLNAACTSLAPPQLVYPAPNATGAPATFDLYVSYPQNPSSAFGPPVLTPSSFAGSVTGTPWSAPSPGPTPP